MARRHAGIEHHAGIDAGGRCRKPPAVKTFREGAEIDLDDVLHSSSASALLF
jgi:hypothetical protein